LYADSILNKGKTAGKFEKSVIKVPVISTIPSSTKIHASSESSNNKVVVGKKVRIQVDDDVVDDVDEGRNLYSKENDYAGSNRVPAGNKKGKKESDKGTSYKI
jgi:hypothetical protein